MATFEEASRCPKCDNTGEQKSMQAAPEGSKLYIFTCRNEPCAWYLTDWVVQRLEDGTIPERVPNRQKTFPSIPGMTQEKAAAQIEQTIKDEDRDRQGR